MPKPKDPVPMLNCTFRCPQELYTWIGNVAEKEQRTIANMMRVLMEEARAARTPKGKR